MKNRGIELKNLLNYYNKKYYEEGISEISDNEYDRLYEEYCELEKQFPELKDDNSPTVKVGEASTTNFPKFTHKSPLLSIDRKSRELEDLRKFFVENGEVEVIVEPKLDGITCNVNYEHAAFTNASTRGNGYVGDLITNNFKNTDTKYPSEIETETLEVRGEAIIPYDKFKKHLSNEYSNPRNAVAGLMRSKDSKDVKNKHIQVMFYDTGITTLEEPETDNVNITKLEELGFQTVPYFICKTWDELKNCVETKLNGLIVDKDGFNVLDSEGYPQAVCDGLVIKVNNLKLRKELGFSQKGPKWAFAYKFKPLQSITKIRQIEWQVGKSGRVCPVAVFDPVSLGGTTITRATLNNFDYMSNLPVWDNGQINLEWTQKLEKDNTIIIERSNDVIPRIVAKYPTPLNDWDVNCCEILQEESKLAETFNEPKTCPCCGKELVKEGPLHYCISPICPAQIKGKIEHFVSRDAMNIVSLGTETIEILYNLGLLTSIQDIYKLKDHRDELLGIRGFQAKKVDKILKSIEDSKNVDFWRFIYSLSLPNIGKRASKDLAQRYTTLDELLNASTEDIMNIENFAEKTAEGIVDCFNEEFIKTVREISSYLTFKEATKTSDKFKGKSFVITGTLECPRTYYQELIESNGGKVSNSVSSKTYAILIGADAGSKETKARDLKAKGSDIIILDSEELIKNFL